MEEDRSGTGSQPLQIALRPRFTPLLVETTQRRTGQQQKSIAKISPTSSTATESPNLSLTTSASSVSSTTSTTDKGKTRFAPEPIETIRRSRKAGDTTPVLDHNEKRADCLATDRSRFSKPELIETSKWSRKFGEEPSEQVLQADPWRRSGRWRVPRRQSSQYPHHNSRQHSYALPELEPIISKSDSEKSLDSEVPSLSTSPSLSSREPSFLDLQIMGRRRESCDDRFSGYLLALAARAAEKQLKQQALEAYPNSSEPERVDHFATDHDGELPEPPTPSVFRAIQEAGGDADMLRKDTIAELEGERTMGSSYYDDVPNYLPHEILSHFEKTPLVPAAATDDSRSPAVTERDPENEVMRRAAHAPRLGENLTFAICHSPRRLSIDYERPKISRESTKEGTPAASPASGGLWMGFCKAKPKAQGLHCLNSPVISNHAAPCPVVTEATLDAEFTDDFVTEVYNYLSLGYPSLAYPFDEELSRLSGLSLEEIQSTDSHIDSQGYVGVEEGGVKEALVVGRSGRWQALRVYIRAWGKEFPGLGIGGVGVGGYGMVNRRGSWKQ